MNKEVWKPVCGFEEYYEVSNMGNVRSKDRMVWNGRVYYKKSGRNMKKSPTSTGYWKIRLTNSSGKGKDYKIHRLVGAAFIPNPFNKPFINHIDGDPLNNRADNLEWCTQSENIIHAYETGLNPSNFHKYKEKALKEYLSNPDIGIKTLCEKYDFTHATMTRYLKANGIRIKSKSELKDKYKINREQLIRDFESGLSNKEIAKKHKTNSTLIATYKYKHKKGELII